jgi:hypothetical protein
MLPKYPPLLIAQVLENEHDLPGQVSPDRPLQHVMEKTLGRVAEGHPGVIHSASFSSLARAVFDMPRASLAAERALAGSHGGLEWIRIKTVFFGETKPRSALFSIPIKPANLCEGIRPNELGGKHASPDRCSQRIYYRITLRVISAVEGVIARKEHNRIRYNI